ncbi:hypothetical protein GOB57_24380 [Sinorhizobium meliloti]|nr:hypothetical protein [Sinorhizobium meliloti]
MVRIARGGSGDGKWPPQTEPRATKTTPKAPKPAASKIKDMIFHVEGAELQISVHAEDRSIEKIERMVSYAVGCRNDLDLTIHGFQGMSN